MHFMSSEVVNHDLTEDSDDLTSDSDDLTSLVDPRNSVYDQLEDDQHRAATHSPNPIAAIEENRRAASFGMARPLSSHCNPESFQILPTDDDVLLGRGRKFRDHPANQRLRTLVSQFRPKYDRSSRDEKTDISKQIVQILKTGGEAPARFLKFEKSTGYWVEIDDESARLKVSHVFRDCKRGKRTLDATVLPPVKPALGTVGESQPARSQGAHANAVVGLQPHQTILEVGSLLQHQGVTRNPPRIAALTFTAATEVATAPITQDSSVYGSTENYLPALNPAYLQNESRQVNLFGLPCPTLPWLVTDARSGMSTSQLTNPQTLQTQVAINNSFFEPKLTLDGSQSSILGLRLHGIQQLPVESADLFWIQPQRWAVAGNLTRTFAVFQTENVAVQIQTHHSESDVVHNSLDEHQRDPEYWRQPTR